MKKFLKPNKRKIIFTTISGIILFIISFFFYLFWDAIWNDCDSGLQMINGHAAMVDCFYSLPSVNSVLLFILIFFVLLIVIYIISCMIFWLYEKNRKSKKNK